MQHPTHTLTGPADLALPLALVTELAADSIEGSAADYAAEPDAHRASGPRRAPEVRSAAGRRSRAARRRAKAVRG
ncbi:hypothetical protein ABT218_18075 [Streptomyces sp. NPDC001455]|uniref:hypothetical protein n=1 Tax=unclassified Streptomyces TaxID=2593676 RepID=UPI0033179F3E